MSCWQLVARYDIPRGVKNPWQENFRANKNGQRLFIGFNIKALACPKRQQAQTFYPPSYGRQRRRASTCLLLLLLGWPWALRPVVAVKVLYGQLLATAIFTNALRRMAVPPRQTGGLKKAAWRPRKTTQRFGKTLQHVLHLWLVSSQGIGSQSPASMTGKFSHIWSSQGIQPMAGA